MSESGVTAHPDEKPNAGVNAMRKAAAELHAKQTRRRGH